MIETSTADIATDRPARYAKQLVSHMARKVQAVWNDTDESGTITFASAVLTLQAGEGALQLALRAEPDDLDIMEDVVGRHLVRFGVRDELVVQWHREDGRPGTVQCKSED